MAHPALMDTKVEIGFGYTPYSTSVIWTDISDYVDVRSSGAVMVAKSGRSGTAGITPGSLSLTLENRDARFNPRNTAGPYYGNLKNGVPIRVVVTVDAVPITRWRGFVSGGWPQDLTSHDQTVQLQAHDIIGLMAQSPAPSSAWDVAVDAMSPQPDHHWRPGQGGWVDRLTAKRADHALGALFPFDSVVNGGDKSWGQSSPEGYGLLPDPTTSPDITTANWKIFSMWVRSVNRTDIVADGTGYKNLPLISMRYSSNSVSAFPWLALWSQTSDTQQSSNVILLRHNDKAGNSNWGTGALAAQTLTDGVAHHVMLRIRSYNDTPT